MSLLFPWPNASYLNSFFTPLPFFDIPDPALLILRISLSLTCNMPFLNLPTRLLVFNPLSGSFTGLPLRFVGIINPASWASLAFFSCLRTLAISMPFRIRRGMFPFGSSFPPRWDILESSVRCRSLPGSSRSLYSARIFDSRRRR